MEHDLESLEHQTAPESTRGLFDPPMPNPPTSSKSTDKRRSLQVFGTLDNSRPGNRPPQQHQQQQQHGRGHQRSKSAITSDMLPNQSGHQRNTSFGLHTLAEEEDGQRRHAGAAGASSDESVTVDSLQTMINTLKSLPPYSKDENNAGSPSTSRRNSRRSISSFGLAPQQGRRMSYSNGRSSNDSGIDIQALLPIPSESKKANRRSSTSSTSMMHMRTNSTGDEDEGGSILSREAARAEAEAKLMGTFSNNNNGAASPDPSGSLSSSRRQSVRSSMSSDLSKRVSLQLPTVSENEGRSGNRRISFNKPLNLGNDTNKSMNRRSSRNYDDWRSSNPSSPAIPYSPRSANYRNSFNLVPFTPTRVNFARDDANPHQRRPLFIAHLPFSALTPLLRARQLVRGLLRVNKRNRSDAYVSCDELDSDIYICGSRDRNRALEGDVVAVRLVDVDKVLREKKEKEEAKLARNHGHVKVRLPDEEDENEIIFGGDDEVDTVKPKYCGLVVAILERAANQVFSGTLQLMRPNNKRAQEEKAAEEAHKAETGQAPVKEAPRIVWFKATDKRVPLIAIPIEQAPADFVENNHAYTNRLFVGSIKRWPITSLHPFGALERELGSINDMDVQTKAILADNNVTDTEFADAVMECLPFIPYTIDADTLAARRNLCETRMFTLTSVDDDVLDNALSIQKLGDDTFEIGVHVSDVTHFIKPHSALDKEARARAIRVQLLHKSVPILPKELTEQVTNLIPNEERLAFSIIWKLSSSGKILDTWLGKTVVKSCAQLTVEDAQKAIDNQELDAVTNKELREGLVQDIAMLYDIAQSLHDARFKDGAMSQMRDELTFEFDENGEPVTFGIKKPHASSMIIKEFSLLANRSVAQKISSQFPEQALLRRHAPPNKRKIRELQEYALKSLAVPVDISSAGRIERAIESIKDPQLRKVVSVIVLKTMQPPKYFCTGTLDIMKYAHYALNVPLFTHFTSPSSRFADIIVHRQLEAVLTGEKRFYLDRDTVQKLAQHCNVKKEAALYAREQSSMLFLASYLNKRGVRPADASHITVVRREAIIVAVFDQFFDVMIPELNIQKRIHLANLPTWRSEFDQQDRTLTLYWTKGMDTTTGKQRSWSMSDDEEDDLDEEALLEEMRDSTANGESISTSLQEVNDKQQPSSSQQQQQQEPSITAAPPAVVPETTRSTSKRASMVHARLSESTGYSTDLGSQTIKALDKIQVLVTVEMVKTPPLIRILAANPYA